MKEIRYQYALEGDEIVSIHDIEKEKSIVYRCISCGDILVPRLKNDIRRRHFAHKPKDSSQGSCSKETYLHSLAKIVFAEEFRKCRAAGKPFRIELKQEITCDYCLKFANKACTREDFKSYDLSEYYGEIDVEKTFEGFQPDLLLMGKKGRVLFVEIHVTHPCESRKLNSGIRILEIRISAESDLKRFTDHFLSESDENVKFYNFTRKVPTLNFCGQPEGPAYRWFLLYSNGTSTFQWLRIPELQSLIDKGLIQMSGIHRSRRRGIPFSLGKMQKKWFSLGLNVKLTHCPDCGRRLKTNIVKGKLWCSWCGGIKYDLSQKNL